jgi:hypothetical protein
MSKKLSYAAVITFGVVLSTLVNVFFITPKKVSAATPTFSYQRRSCTVLNTVAGSDSNSNLEEINTDTADEYIKAGTAWTRCPSGQIMTAVKFRKVNGGGTGSADSIVLDIECCEVSV